MTNIREKLFIPCKKLSKNIPLEAADLHELLKVLPVDEITPRYTTIIELLRLKQVSLTRERVDLHTETEQKIKTLASILIHNSDYLEIDGPIKFLVKGKFERFEGYCLQNKDEEYRQLPRKARGIYPSSSQVYPSPQPVFAKSSGERSGNANWMYSRFVLSTWCELQKPKRKENIQQIINFLLSNREFLYNWSKQPFKHLWAALYLYYNKLLLNLNFNIINESKITWINEQNQYYEAIIVSLQKKIFGRQSILYYLIADNLEIKSQQEGKGDHFKKAFDVFNKDYTRQCINVGQQHLFALILFKCLAILKYNSQITDICQHQIKQILIKKKLESLFPIYQHFLSIKEIVEIAENENNSTNLWNMKLGEQFYSELTQFNLRRSVYRLEMLPYMNQEDCLKHLFGNHNLADINMGSILIKIMSDHDQQMRSKLKNITKVNITPLLQRNFNLFLNVWNNYYRLVQANSIQSFELIFTTDQNSFDSDFRDIFYCPLSNTYVISDALMSFVQGLKGRLDYPLSYFDGVPLLRSFSTNLLQRALDLISQQKKALFQREWNQIVERDTPQVAEQMTLIRNLDRNEDC